MDKQTMNDALSEQIERLANFIIYEVPGEPSQSEGAIDTAIRWMRSALLAQGTERREQAGVPDEMVLSVAEKLCALGWASGGDYLDDFVPDVRAALEAVTPSRVPDGWQLVPVEPTEAMIFAARRHHEGDPYLPHSLFRAMLAAAPQPDTGKE